MSDKDWLSAYVDQVVCVDLKDGFVLYGTLQTYSEEALSFINADFHDPREANSSKDVYALETQNIGVRVNRKQCQIPRLNLISICLLSELA